MAAENKYLRTGGRAASVVDLPGEVLIAVLGRLELKERHRSAAQVCRRWHRAANSAHLLRCLDISLDGSHSSLEAFEQHFHSLAEWMAVRAAPHVQQLGLDLRMCVSWNGNEPGHDDEAEIRLNLPAMMAACGARSQLTSLRLHHDCWSLPISSWLAGLGRSLQQLSVTSETLLYVSWLTLPALRELSLAAGDVVKIPSNVALPVTLTKLCLSDFEGDDGLPPQIGALTRLLELRISDSTFTSDEYTPLARLSSSLTRLDLHNTYRLPDCLGQLTSLQALAATGFIKHADEDSMDGILKAALPRLTSLTHLELSSMGGAQAPPPELASLRQLATFAWHGPGPNGTALPDGPWLTSLRSVQGPPGMLVSSLQQLAAAGQLSEVVATNFDSGAAAAAIDILRWAAHRSTLQSLTLRSDSLPHKVVNEVVWLKGVRPDLSIRNDP